MSAVPPGAPLAKQGAVRRELSAVKAAFAVMQIIPAVPEEISPGSVVLQVRVYAVPLPLFPPIVVQMMAHAAKAVVVNLVISAVSGAPIPSPPAVHRSGVSVVLVVARPRDLSGAVWMTGSVVPEVAMPAVLPAINVVQTEPVVQAMGYAARKASVVLLI